MVSLIQCPSREIVWNVLFHELNSSLFSHIFIGPIFWFLVVLSIKSTSLFGIPFLQPLFKNLSNNSLKCHWRISFFVCSENGWNIVRNKKREQPCDNFLLSAIFLRSNQPNEDLIKNINVWMSTDNKSETSHRQPLISNTGDRQRVLPHSWSKSLKMGATHHGTRIELFFQGLLLFSGLLDTFFRLL